MSEGLTSPAEGFEKGVEDTNTPNKNSLNVSDTGTSNTSVSNYSPVVFVGDN